MAIYSLGKNLNPLFKKKVEITNTEVIFSGKHRVALVDIKKVFVTKPSLQAWGTVFLSTDGNSSQQPNFEKFAFAYTSKMQNEVGNFLKELNKDVEYIAHPNQNSAIEKVEEGEKMSDNRIKCPSCSSINVQFLQQDKKSFSVGKAVGGALLTGGIGALAGFTGKKGNKQWHCLNCGNLFETR